MCSLTEALALINKLSTSSPIFPRLHPPDSLPFTIASQTSSHYLSNNTWCIKQHFLHLPMCVEVTNIYVCGDSTWIWTYCKDRPKDPDNPRNPGNPNGCPNYGHLGYNNENLKCPECTEKNREEQEKKEARARKRLAGQQKRLRQEEKREAKKELEVEEEPEEEEEEEFKERRSGRSRRKPIWIDD